MKLRKRSLYALLTLYHIKFLAEAQQYSGIERYSDREYYPPFDEFGRRGGKSEAELDSIISCPGMALWALAWLFGLWQAYAPGESRVYHFPEVTMYTWIVSLA